MKRKISYLFFVCTVLLCAFCGCGEKADLILRGTESLQSQESEEAAGRPDSERSDDARESKDSGTGSENEEKTSVFVYICGAVKYPGVYEMAPGSRIYQVVDQAGGMTKKADEKSVNLAETVSDGQMVQIPEILPEGEKTQKKEETSSGVTADGKININTATAEQLMTLRGIGQAKAECIIAYREKKGAFQKIEDITLVEGIKEGTFEKIRESIAVQ